MDQYREQSKLTHKQVESGSSAPSDFGIFKHVFSCSFLSVYMYVSMQTRKQTGESIVNG